MKQVQIGPLRQEVTWLQRSTASNDSYGQPSYTYTAIGTFFASVQPVSAREIIAAQAQEALLTHTVTTRWFGDGLGNSPIEKDRLTFERFYPDGTTHTATLEIASVIDPDEIHRFLIFICTEVRA